MNEHEIDPHDRNAPGIEATRVLPNPAVAGLGTVTSGPNGLPTTLPGIVLQEKEGIASTDDTEPEWHYHPDAEAIAEFAATPEPGPDPVAPDAECRVNG